MNRNLTNTTNFILKQLNSVKMRDARKYGYIFSGIAVGIHAIKKLVEPVMSNGYDLCLTIGPVHVDLRKNNQVNETVVVDANFVSNSDIDTHS